MPPTASGRGLVEDRRLLRLDAAMVAEELEPEGANRDDVNDPHRKSGLRVK